MGIGLVVGLCVAAVKLGCIVVWAAVKFACCAIAWIVTLIWRALGWVFRRIVRGVKRSRAKREQGAKGSANPRSRQISRRTQAAG